MKITRLTAEKVHGYMPLDIKFFDDLTFLTGLNGSGKTSALRLLMALLTPNIDELGSISFSDAAATVDHNGREIVVRASKTSERVELTTSYLPDAALYISSSDLELYMDVRRREDARSPLLERFQQNPVYEFIRSISTPMFLGLDRRFFAPGAMSDEEQRKRDYLLRRYWHEEPGLRPHTGFGAATLMLTEVNYLVVNRTQEIRAEQARLDDSLRSKFLTKAFEYNPGEIGKPTTVPSRSDIESYRKQLGKIEKAAGTINIPFPEIQSTLKTFFERLTRVVDEMNRDVQPHRPTANKAKRRKAQSPKSDENPVQMSPSFVEWIINKPQADRIVEHLRLLESYVADRTALHEPIERFLKLVNDFFQQTRKTVSVTSTGQLIVQVSGFAEHRAISALSSGERQLLVMLAHLSLNPSLAESGVFIVDEPELSLHIDWQEKFVDAVRAANPKVQLILATHSPAIILDRTDWCRALSHQ